MPFSFTYHDQNCPECRVSLINNEGPPSVAVSTNNKLIRTTIGEPGNFYDTYVLDPNGDACLILDNPRPTVTCLGCGTNLRIDAHQEF